MKRFLTLILSLGIAASLVGCGNSQSTGSDEGSASSAASSSAAASGEKITFSIATHSVEKVPITEAYEHLADALNATGEFDVTVYPNSQLGTVVDVLDRVIDGDPIMESGSPGDISDPLSIPDLTATMAPFLYDSIDEIGELTSSDWFKDLEQQSYDKGIKILTAGFCNGERFFLTRKPVPEPSDMKGMKIRVPANTAYINAFTAFGATPTPLATTEIYTSLQQKIVDGVEQPLPDIYLNGYQEVVSNVANQDYLKEPQMLFMPTSLWESMTAEQQDIMNQCAAEAVAFELDYYTQYNAEAKDNLEKAGVNFYDIDVDAYKQAAEAYWTMNDQWSAGLKETVYSALGK